MKNRTPTHRIHRQPRAVRPHPSGAWTVSIGKTLNRQKTKLRPKDFYFHTTEAEANEAANKLQRKWQFLVENWATMYQPRLEIIDAPFNDIPHWQPSIVEAAGVRQPSDQVIDEDQNRPPSIEEIAEAYEDITLDGVFSLFKLHQQIKVQQGEKQAITVMAMEKNIRNGLAHIGGDRRMSEINQAIVEQAKSMMLGKMPSRRTVKNYLGGVKGMLDWFYACDYGRGFDKPSMYDDIFGVRNATKTNIAIYGADELKTLLIAADDRQRLYILLGMNCGMYQADIGRLTADEVNLKDGYVFWDREKQPDNEFKVAHDLWAETLMLVRKFHQKPSKQKRMIVDYRNGKPIEIDAAKLAFVDDKGEPLYLIRENGSQHDKIIKRWEALMLNKFGGFGKYQFKSLRKSTNQLILNVINKQVNDDERNIIGANEISSMFLGQTNALAKLYRKGERSIYKRMNYYLQKVGDRLREDGVFKQ